MKLYSTRITSEDIGNAARTAGVGFQDTFSRKGWFVPIREFRSRSGAPAFEFFLHGSSPYRAQHDRSEFAATWTEWGIFIAALFEIDPDATIGHYKGQAEFMRLTDKIVWKSRAEKPWLYAAA